MKKSKKQDNKLKAIFRNLIDWKKKANGENTN